MDPALKALGRMEDNYQGLKKRIAEIEAEADKTRRELKHKGRILFITMITVLIQGIHLLII